MSKTKQSTNLTPRPPVVTFMGHIDHGKTSILDYIRHTQLQKKETGGITQSIGAYQVDLPQHNTKITFIDTPGHEAFSKMRARGGQAADIVVLVVAKNDGVMPQTIEAINHAKAAGVPMIVVINKSDLEGLPIEKIKAKLAEQGVLVEGYGGDVVSVETSAKTGQGMDELLEMINLVAQMQGLKADANAKPTGFVLEGCLNEKKGCTASFLVQNGALKKGQIVATNSTFGRIRRMNDWQGREVSKAFPGTPVEVLGLKKVPLAGETFEVVESEKLATQKMQPSSFLPSQPSITTEEKEESTRTLNLIIKADTKGSLEAVHHSVENLQTQEVLLHFLHEGVGNITEADVMLAAATRAIVLGFRVGVDEAAKNAAQMERVIYRTYEIIYKLLEEVEDVIAGEMDKMTLKIIGDAQVIKVFTLSDGALIAGCKVTEGKIKKGHTVQVLRGNEVVGEAQVDSLRHEKEKIGEAKKGVECGIALKPQIEFKEGDIIQAVTY